MIGAYTAILFLSSFLLFWCQPMVGKMILPILGGAPSVWITTQFFFQLLLLAGYAYAHFLTRLKSGILQRGVHFLLSVLAFLFLPFAIPSHYLDLLSRGFGPVAWLLLVLAVRIGLPFFVLSASAPLLQKWFSESGHTRARDPYFLYSASNLGSLLALLGYPVLIEPVFLLSRQNYIWRGGYLMLSLVFLGMIFFLKSSGITPRREESQGNPRTSEPGNMKGNHPRLWLLLAFIPSSLMLGVTSFLASDIASFPLLWVVPLAVYLLTYILAFARRQFFPSWLMPRILPGVSLLMVFVLLTEIRTPVWFLMLVSLLFLFVAAMTCHGALAALRPATSHLTHFYMWISVGGALGGFFNGVVAPMVFNGVTELPLAIVGMFLVLHPWKQKRQEKQLKFDLLLPLAVGIVTVLMAILIPRFTLEPYQLWMFVIFGIPLIAAYTFLHRPLRFGLTLGAIFLGSLFFHAVSGKVVFEKRNFFGTMKITLHPSGPSLRFFHGTTMHGMEFVEAGRKGRPLAYFHNQGPFGQIMSDFHARVHGASVGVIGVGVGSMLAYAKKGEEWTYFEIDPDIVRMARNPKYFSFFSRNRADRVDVVIGDARLTLQEQHDRRFQLLIIDAFSSDVVPTHLLTREALSLYLKKLAPHGMIAGHISSQNLNLTPVLANGAASLGLICLHQEDDRILDASNRPIPGKFPSNWVVLARSKEDLGGLIFNPSWSRPPLKKGFRVWTDDYSNILHVLKWF